MVGTERYIHIMGDEDTTWGPVLMHSSDEILRATGGAQGGFVKGVEKANTASPSQVGSVAVENVADLMRWDSHIEEQPVMGA